MSYYFSMNYSNDFINRHVGINKKDAEKMLNYIGNKNISELIKKTIPKNIRLEKELNLPNGISEPRYLELIKNLGRKNKNYKSYIGLGYYNTVLPSVIKRNILENPNWYTAYTPYQPEIAQGRLEALFNYQTVITELTGMPIANASLLDEGTAAAEAMIMSYNNRSNKNGKNGDEQNTFLVSKDCFPQTIEVLKTRANPIGIKLKVVEEFSFSEKAFGVLIQYPGKHGSIENIEKIIQDAHQNNIIVTVAADLLSLTLLKPPGEFDADVVIGSSQRFGIPMGYGGPHAAYFATKENFKRSVPGRIIGASKDIDGKLAYRMALQTREQHIRRERATSNICTSQVLLAVMASMYAVYHGPDKLKNIAQNIHHNCSILSAGIKNLGFKQLNKYFFDTILVDIGDISMETLKVFAHDSKINFNIINENLLSISLDEKDDLKNVQEILKVFSKIQNKTITQEYFNELINDNQNISNIPSSYERASSFLNFKTFNSFHTETELMRYIKNLERKDLSLTHSMIPLGSCTMKLNAAVQLLPLSWSEFSNIHPFAPLDQSRGYQIMFRELEEDLCEITGYDAISLQPNSGAQGEFAGLMVIRKFHETKNEKHRNICLIPSSAHGTNPASAKMAGMKIVIIKCDKKGNIDFKDLKSKVLEHSEFLSALMITYPSTHGVFENNIQEITSLIHKHGGQVYMDGANMNAQVGLTSPSIIGCDVCHLNLHKTFAIPHGGGGPGMGPIGVKKHLKEFLPGNPLINCGGKQAIPSISSAPWGSGLILTISYAYIKMLGKEGLKKSTEIAILNANYIKKRLENDFKILFTGENDTVAHEMIIDCREFKKYNIEVTDIAKRLMDYGFHAPTVNWPVVGTMMVEPTESESKQSLDLFCDALIMIKKEIEKYKDNDNNILKNAPHNQEILISEDWNYPYSREEAVFPTNFVKQNKFWPTVRRIDEAQGDRNLICSCVSTEEYI